jgi:DNA polymerase-3 subunit alpha
LYTGLVGPKATQRKYHLTVLAATDEGYRNLMMLISLAYAEGFHYEATVSWEWLKKYRKGLIIMSGCQGSLLFCSFVGGKLVPTEAASYARGKSVMRRFRDTFGDAYYAEVQAFPELELTVRANPMIAQAADELGVPLVATMDCHYTEVEEREMQMILHNIRPGNRQSLEDQAREWGYTVPLCPPPNDRSIMRRLQQTGLSRDQALKAIINTDEIAGRCNVTLPKLPMVRFPVPDGYTDSHEVWREWLREGWRFRGCHRLPAAEKARYKKQLAKEMAIIEEKDFVDYHLIVSDAVKWAKDNGVAVGPARGSAAASLACWLLRITEVDPMPYDSMVFERYIDLNRVDLPDIDLDFDSNTRHKVREYMVRQYGTESVSNVGTFSTFKAKMALDDVARVHRIPKFDVESIKELLVERSSGDLRASATIEDTIIQFDAAREAALRNPEIMKAADLEGNVKGFGVHAAGLIISNGPITDVTSVITRTVKGRELKVVALDKYDAERQGLLKLDFLGLNTMSMITRALEQIGMSLQDLYDLPLDDPAAIKIFQENDVVGVFQFEGRAMRSVNGALRADNFKEICDVNALSRPGALHNGSANEYIDIKRGVKKPEKVHPAVDRITASTNYQIVYQEQILRIVREIGNFSWTASAEIRKIISKKVGEQEFNRRWEGFLQGALTLHEREPDMPPMTEEMAKKVWGACITAGSYAFNYAHSHSYSMLGYWTAWLKAHHPAAFYAASLAEMTGTTGTGAKIPKDEQLIRDAVRHGILVLPPDPRESDMTWRALDDRRLLAGFTQIEGIGDKVSRNIIDFREGIVRGPDGEIMEGWEAEKHPDMTWDDLVKIKGIGAKTVEKVKAFVGERDPFGVLRLEEAISAVSSELEGLGLPLPTHKAAEVPYERGEDTQIVWLGVIVHRNLRDIFETNRARTGVELKPEEIKRPDLNEFLLMEGYDGDEVVNIRFNRFIYPKFREAIWGMKLGRDLVLIQGVKPGWRTARELYVRNMWVLDPETG